MKTPDPLSTVSVADGRPPGKPSFYELWGRMGEYCAVASERVDRCRSCGVAGAWVLPYIDGRWPERICHACACMLSRAEAAARFRSSPGNPRSREEGTEGGTGGWGSQDFRRIYKPPTAELARARFHNQQALAAAIRDAATPTVKCEASRLDDPAALVPRGSLGRSRA